MASAFDDVLGPPRATGSAFDDVLGAAALTPAAPAKEQPGRLEALARGAKQGVTFGFGDELSGALDYVLSGGKEGSYTKGRDEARANDAAAKEAHGGYFTAGEVGGGIASSIVPGVGELGGLVKGAGFAANAVRGAGAGILSGIGNSESTDVAGIAKDAAISGLAGGAVGGVVGGIANKVAGGAVERAESAELAGLKEGVQGTAKLKVFGKATPEAPEGQFTANIKAALKSEPAIKTEVNRDAHKALGMVDRKVTGLTDTLEHIYEKAAPAGPVNTKAAIMGLEEAAGEFKTTATKSIAKTIAGVADDLQASYPEGIPLQVLRKEYRDWQDVANASSKLFSSKSPKEEAAEAVANSLRETLRAHVGAVAEKMPELGISRQALEATSKEVSTWLRVLQAMEQKASRINVNSAPMGDLVNKAAHPIRTAVSAVGGLAAPADRQLARLIVASNRGDLAARASLKALLMGTPRGLAANATDIPGAALTAATAPFMPDDSSY